MRSELNQARADASVLSEARRIAEAERDAALREEARKDGILQRVEAEAAETENKLIRCAGSLWFRAAPSSSFRAPGTVAIDRSDPHYLS